MKNIRHMRALCFALLFVGSSALRAEPVGEISIVVGLAYGTPPNGTRTELAVAYPVSADEFIETKEGGGMSVIFLDGTEFRLGSKSSAMMDRFLFDPNAPAGGALQLGEGVFRFISSAGSDHNGVEIQTPNSVIGIRGTDFVAIVDHAKGTTLGTASGLIEVTAMNTGQTNAINPGQMGQVQPDGSVSVVEAPVPADELACWLAQDTYICLAEASEAGAPPASVDPKAEDREAPEPNNNSPDPPAPNNPGDPVNDPADPGPNDPGSDPGQGGGGGGYDGG